MMLPTADGLYEVPPHVRVGLYARYRGIDVDREIQLAGLWLEKNPSRRPKNPIRFLENWLRKIYGKPKINGAAQTGSHAHRPSPTAEVANPPAPTLNGAAAPAPLAVLPKASSHVLATAAAPPSVRLATGPKSIGEVLAGLRQQLRSKG